jgi:protein MpaA
VAPETEKVIGYSVAGRPIIAYRRGTVGGTPVVAVGAIHGDEVGGAEVAYTILDHAVPEGIELWVIPVANPDGYTAKRRQNDRMVDLNRNFPTANWAEKGRGTEKWSGYLPASEPETIALANFFLEVRPVLTVWYHQNGRMVDVGANVADPTLRVKYSEVSGWPLGTACPSVCRGTATGFTNANIQGSTAFVVELRWGVTPEIAAVHVTAFFETAVVAVSKV